MGREEYLNKLITLTKPHFAKGQEEVDITAVERCIKSKLEYMTRIDECSGDRHFTVVGGGGQSLCSIKDKPLTLYTLEELEELYKLIKKLGKH